jgi:hypothetical protein
MPICFEKNNPRKVDIANIIMPFAAADNSIRNNESSVSAEVSASEYGTIRTDAITQAVSKIKNIFQLIRFFINFSSKIK